MTDWPEWAASWTPPVDTRTTAIARHPVAGLAAWLDAPGDVADTGALLPPLWHWVALSSWPDSATVGPDGHPATGGFMPPMPYPHRMWLGCTVDITDDVQIGDPVVVERTVTGLVEKSGSNGTFALATVTTTVTPAGETTAALTERTQFAYRPESPRDPSPATAPTASQSTITPWLERLESGTWALRPNPVMLMHFSALTANGHRIHYDTPYATQVEGYPNLLVHGPLMATVLAEVVRREHPDRTLASFSCRAQRPLFLGTTAAITETTATEDTMTLDLRDDSAGSDGPACMSVEVRFR